MKTASARPRRSAGNRSPISDVAAGAQEASPTPTPRRSTNSSQNPRARPHSPVSTLQTKTPADKMRVRAFLSLSRPRGTPATA